MTNTSLIADVGGTNTRCALLDENDAITTVAVLKNDKGVVIRMTSAEAGLKLKLAPGGFKIEIVE